MVKLPEKVELDFSDIPVQDQGELGAATAFAVCAAMEYMLKHPQPKREFLYYEVRELTP